MNEYEQELLGMIHGHPDPEHAILVAVKIILQNLPAERLGSSREPAPADQQE